METSLKVSDRDDLGIQYLVSRARENFHWEARMINDVTMLSAEFVNIAKHITLKNNVDQVPKKA